MSKHPTKPASYKLSHTEQDKKIVLQALALLEGYNEGFGATRKVTPYTAQRVVKRSLSRDYSLSYSQRSYRALHDLSNFANLLQNNKVLTASAENTDLLPVAHPLSTKPHSISDYQIRVAQSRYWSDDPMVTGDVIPSLIASAFTAAPNSGRRDYALARLSAMGSHRVPLGALVAAFKDGANDGFWRRQLRDGDGRFAIMGRGLRIRIRRAKDGVVKWLMGDAVSTNVPENSFTIETPDGKLYKAPANASQSVKAIIDDGQGKDGYSGGPANTKAGDVVIDENDLEVREAPDGWERDADFRPGQDEVDYYGDDEDLGAGLNNGNYKVVKYAKGRNAAANKFELQQKREVDGEGVVAFGKGEDGELDPELPIYFLKRNEPDAKTFAAVQSWRDVQDLIEDDEKDYQANEVPAPKRPSRIKKLLTSKIRVGNRVDLQALRNKGALIKGNPKANALKVRQYERMLKKYREQGAEFPIDPRREYFILDDGTIIDTETGIVVRDNVGRSNPDAWKQEPTPFDDEQFDDAPVSEAPSEEPRAPRVPRVPEARLPNNLLVPGGTVDWDKVDEVVPETKVMPDIAPPTRDRQPSPDVVEDYELPADSVPDGQRSPRDLRAEREFARKRLRQIDEDERKNNAVSASERERLQKRRDEINAELAKRIDNGELERGMPDGESSELVGNPEDWPIAEQSLDELRQRRAQLNEAIEILEGGEDPDPLRAVPAGVVRDIKNVRDMVNDEIQARIDAGDREPEDAPEGFYDLDRGAYEPEGGIDGQTSPDYTDDPAELANKFTTEQLVTALRQGLKIGVGYLPFQNGDELVNAEAIYNALKEQGVDADRIVDNIYRAGDGKPVPEVLPDEQANFGKDLPEPPVSEPSQQELPPVLEGLSDEEKEALDADGDIGRYIPENKVYGEGDVPEGYYRINEENFRLLPEDVPVGAPENVKLDPIDIARDFKSEELEAELRRALAPEGNIPGYGVLAYETPDDDQFPYFVNVPAEAIRDALKLQGVDTDELIDKIYADGFRGQRGDEPSPEEVDEALEGEDIEEAEEPEAPEIENISVADVRVGDVIRAKDGSFKEVVRRSPTDSGPIFDYPGNKREMFDFEDRVDRQIVDAPEAEEPAEEFANVRDMSDEDLVTEFFALKLELGIFKNNYERGYTLPEDRPTIVVKRIEEIRAEQDRRAAQDVPEDLPEDLPEDNPLELLRRAINGEDIGQNPMDVLRQALNRELSREASDPEMDEAPAVDADAPVPSSVVFPDENVNVPEAGSSDNIVTIDIDGDIRAQLERAIENGDRIKFFYRGKVRIVTPMSVWDNPKNGNINLYGPDETDGGIKKNFTLDRMERIPEDADEPVIPEAPEAPEPQPEPVPVPTPEAPAPTPDPEPVPAPTPEADDPDAGADQEIVDGIANRNLLRSPGRNRDNLPDIPKNRRRQVFIRLLAGLYADVDGNPLAVGDRVKHVNPKIARKYGEGVVINKVQGKIGGLQRAGVVYVDYVMVQYPDGNRQKFASKFQQHQDPDVAKQRFEAEEKINWMNKAEMKEALEERRKKPRKNKEAPDAEEQQEVQEVNELVEEVEEVTVPPVANKIVGDKFDDLDNASAVREGLRIIAENYLPKFRNNRAPRTLRYARKKLDEELLVMAKRDLVQPRRAAYLRNVADDIARHKQAKEGGPGAFAPDKYDVAFEVEEELRNLVERMNQLRADQIAGADEEIRVKQARPLPEGFLELELDEILADGGIDKVDEKFKELMDFLPEVVGDNLLFNRVDPDFPQREGQKAFALANDIREYIEDNKARSEADRLKLDQVMERLIFKLNDIGNALERGERDAQEPTSKEFYGKALPLYLEFRRVLVGVPKALRARNRQAALEKLAQPMPDGLIKSGNDINKDDLVAFIKEAVVRLPEQDNVNNYDANPVQARLQLEGFLMKINEAGKDVFGASRVGLAKAIEYLEDEKKLLGTDVLDNLIDNLSAQNNNIGEQIRVAPIPEFGGPELTKIDVLGRAQERVKDRENLFKPGSAFVDAFSENGPAYQAANKILEPFKAEYVEFFDGEEKPLALLGYRARQALQQFVGQALKENKAGADEERKNYIDLAFQLDEEERAYLPRRTQLDGEANVFRQIQFSDALGVRKGEELLDGAGNPTGWVKDIDDGGGINTTHRFKHNVTQQTIWIKSEKYDITANAEIYSSELANALGIQGVPIVERFDKDTRGLFLNGAGEDIRGKESAVIARDANLNADKFVERLPLIGIIKFGILDAIIDNSDRHKGNYLLREKATYGVESNGYDDWNILPIDHGYAQVFLGFGATEVNKFMYRGGKSDLNRELMKRMGRENYKEMFLKAVRDGQEAYLGMYGKNPNVPERKTVADRMQEILDWSDADWDEIFKQVGGVA